MPKILLLGGDARQHALKKQLESQGYAVSTAALFADDCFSPAYEMARNDVLLCPIPFSTDAQFLFSPSHPKQLPIEEFVGLLRATHTVLGGNLPGGVRRRCDELGIPCHDLMQCEDVRLRNTTATAEGAIAEAIRHSAGNLCGSDALVLGYGRCGQTLADLLRGLHAHVTVQARTETNRARAQSLGYPVLAPAQMSDSLHTYTYIFNTVPAPILDDAHLSLLHPDVTILDIASAPGGVDHAACARRNINAHLCLGLPGKFAPQASAGILLTAIQRALFPPATP